MSDDDINGTPLTNAAMVNELQRSGVLRSPECIAAFLAADRRHFWAEHAYNIGDIYDDNPVRFEKLHLSAPHIYAKALESFMPFRPGMSFLNVGSGTGYFNSIVGELIGNAATNHGIDIWPEVVKHAADCCHFRGSGKIEFTLGNVYELDVNRTVRYDRIYIGACANSRSKYLYRLLDVGGVLIGPFQTGHSQQLRRVTRVSESQFNVAVLGSVHFATLVEPVPPSAHSAAAGNTDTEGGSAATLRRAVALRLAAITGNPPQSIAGSMQMAREPLAIGLPDVPFSFELCEKPWTPGRCWMFPASYKRVVRASLNCRPSSYTRVCLPMEVWLEHIFPWCPKSWFEVAKSVFPVLGPFSPAPRISSSQCPSLGFSALPEAALPPMSPLRSASKAPNSEDELSDDGTSTHVPSSSTSSSIQSTPETHPGSPPFGPAISEVVGMSLENNLASDMDVLFEVYGDGHRHTIGAQNDPDDMVYDRFAFMAPLGMLQRMAGGEPGHRHHHWVEEEEDEEIHHSEDEEEEEELQMEEGEDVASEEEGEDEEYVTASNESNGYELLEDDDAMEEDAAMDEDTSI